jgi:hypothetical protein
MRFLRKWGIALLLLLATGVVVGYGIYRRKQWKKDRVYVELKAFQTSKGWGYDILTNGRPYIHQDIVPAVTSHGYGFRTKEDALAVGQKIYDRVISGKMPMVTQEELKEMGIVPADSLHR